MRAFAAALAAAIAACSSGAGEKVTNEDTAKPAERAVPPVEVGKYAKVYSGDEGLRITLVPVTSEAPEKALIEVSGVPSEIDGVVLLYERVDQGRMRWAYKTTLHGDDHWTVHANARHQKTQIDVFIPGISGRRNATYDEEASAAVDPQEIAERHADKIADGTIARLQAFNREERQKAQEEAFADNLAGAAKVCGEEIPGEIDWSTISDDQLKDISISGYCDPIRTAAERLCEYPLGKKAFQQRVDRIRCAFGDQAALRLEKGGTLLWVTDPDGKNLAQLAYDLARPAFGRDRLVLASESGVRIILDPGDAAEPLYFSKDGKVFYEQRESTSSASGDNRYLWAGGARSRLAFDDGAWRLTCGERKVALRELPENARKKALAAAELEEQRWKRTPFALARDDRGRYYYVDRFIDKYGGKGFRVFVGLKGRAKLTKLMDIVDDSDATIFATSDGKLRLLISRKREAREATWIQGKRRRELTVLPLHRNQDLIFGQLGVYAGESLGSVCEEI